MSREEHDREFLALLARRLIEGAPDEPVVVEWTGPFNCAARCTWRLGDEAV